MELSPPAGGKGHAAVQGWRACVRNEDGTRREEAVRTGCRRGLPRGAWATGSDMSSPEYGTCRAFAARVVGRRPPTRTPTSGAVNGEGAQTRPTACNRLRPSTRRPRDTTRASSRTSPCNRAASRPGPGLARSPGRAHEVVDLIPRGSTSGRWCIGPSAGHARRPRAGRVARDPPTQARPASGRS